MPLDDGSRQNLVRAIEEAEAILRTADASRLTAADLQSYATDGYVIARSIVPERLADVLREHVIYPGFKLEGFDVDDPTTWGKGGCSPEKLSFLERVATALGSETAYYGRWCSYGRALEASDRTDISSEDLEMLRRAFCLANAVAALRIRPIMDQLAGKDEWDDGVLQSWNESPLEDGLPKRLHVRFGLPSKDRRYSAADHAWPLFGWHIDGAWHNHMLGRKIEHKSQGLVPDHACVGILTYSKILPKGGATGVIPGSHMRNMQKVFKYTRRGGIPNASLLIRNSLFGGAAVDSVGPDTSLQPGDAILMHPYLSHSSAWNFQPGLRVASRLSFEYKTPHDGESLQEMWRRQKETNEAVPPNTDLFQKVLSGGSWSADDWNSKPSASRAFWNRKMGLTLE